ncbi:MAG: hypothetical protein ACI9TV_000802 [Sulfurimonas sp.]|jgi:hypothetical protein
MSEKIVKYFFILLAASFVFALIYKATKPNDYRHPRDRSIKLH